MTEIYPLEEMYLDFEALAANLPAVVSQACTCGSSDCVFVSDHADGCGYRSSVVQ